MSQARQEELRASIQRELDSLPHSAQGGYARLGWLAEHLKLYVSRLDGLAAAGVPGVALINGDLWAVLELGADALATEVQSAGAPPALTAPCESLASAVKRGRTTGDVGSLEGLKAAVDALSAALAR